MIWLWLVEYLGFVYDLEWFGVWLVMMVWWEFLWVIGCCKCELGDGVDDELVVLFDVVFGVEELLFSFEWDVIVLCVVWCLDDWC